MIVTGGLGNQMFQYAMVLALRNQGHEVKIDISYYDFFKMHNGYELNRVFGIKEELYNKQGIHILWLRLLNKLKPSFLYDFDSLEYTPSILANPKNYLFGYWQNEKYFKSIEKTVRDLFVFRNIDSTNEKIAKEMQGCESVSLHIRRGDYAEFGLYILEESYYKEAIKFIQSRYKMPIFYIFSDDMDESEKIANSLGIQYYLISHNRGKESYKDMYLISQCKHHIIANSSFSWWGAWLGKNGGGEVIAPKLWLHDMPLLRPQINSWVLL